MNKIRIPFVKIFSIGFLSVVYFALSILWVRNLLPSRSITSPLTIHAQKVNFLPPESLYFTIQKPARRNTISRLGFFPKVSAKTKDKVSNIKIQVFNAYRKPVDFNYDLKEDKDTVSVLLSKATSIPLGKYTIKAHWEMEDIKYIGSQDFTWGVLALNTDKAEYLHGETAHVDMAVLNDYGEMVCDADVTLSITDPDGSTVVLSTQDTTITISPECFFYGATKTSDYFTSYQVRKIGTYQLTLTARTNNGVRSIQDSFTVKKDFEFDLQRIGPTRLFPETKYQMAINIKAGKNYTGPVVEYVPSSFTINPGKGMVILHKGDQKELKWQGKFQKGRNYQLKYEFIAPNISPEFYLLGQAKIGDWQEKRFWQMAVDAKTLSSVSMTAPTVTQNLTVGQTFTMTCDPSCSGQGGNPDVTDNYQYTTTAGCGSGNTNIPTSGAVLTAATNPETATNCGSTSETITAASAGTVYISCYSTESARTARSAECVTVTVTNPLPTVNQNHYRWRDDFEAESGTTWQNNNEDTATTSVRANRVKRLRLEAANTGSGSATDYTYGLEYGTNSDCTTGSWSPVGNKSPCSATVKFCMADSQLIDIDATTNINPGLTDTGSFTAGQQVEDLSETGVITVAASAFTENEYALKVNTSTPENTAYYFRMSNAGTALDTYGSCAQLTTGAANLNQVHYRWRDDFEAESGTTWQGNNEDTATTTVGIGKVIRLRLEVSLTEMASSSRMYILQYGTNSDPKTDASWDTIRASGSCNGAPFCMNASNLTEDGATTNINPGLTDGNTTFVAGAQKETNATTTSISLDTTKFTEMEYAFQVTPAALAGQSYYFRLATTTSDGVSGQLSTYTVTPQLTITSTGIALVQQKTCTHTYGAPALSITCTLDAAATANNLLVSGISTDKSAGVYTVPTDFTSVHDYVSANVSGAMAYKVVAGGETSITWNYTVSEESSAWVGEYTGLASASVEDVKQENDSGVAAVTSLNTGTTAATAQANELAIAMMAVDSPTNIDAGRSWSNNFYEMTLVGSTDPSSGTGGLSVAAKVLSSTGTQESTFSCSDTGDQMYAVIGTFKTSSATGAFDAYASSTMSFNASLPVLFTSQTSTITKLGSLKVVDDRGSSAGWVLNLTGNDWKTTTGDMQLDYDGNGTNGNLGKLCANPAVGNLYAESGSLSSVNKGTLDCFGSDVTVIDLVTASNGYGNGTYWLTDMSLGQYIPSNPTATVYTTTLIFTLQ